MIIKLGNIKSTLVGDWSEIKQAKEYLTVKFPNYEKSNAHKERGWNGDATFMSKDSKFLSGFVPLLYKKFPCHIVDRRTNLPKIPKNLVTSFSDITLRNYQYDDVRKSITNGIENTIWFPRGIINEATNAGKTYVAASIYKTLDCPTLFIIHDLDTFRQSFDFFSQYFEVGVINSRKMDIKKFTMCTPKVLLNRWKKFVGIKKLLKETQMVIVDECHKVAGDEYFKLMNKINAPVRYFMSGTSLDRKSDFENCRIIGHSGPVISRISNKQLIDLGVSMRASVKILNVKDNSLFYTNYSTEISSLVKFNRKKNAKIKEYCINKSGQILISVKHIDHAEHLGKILSDIGKNVKVLTGGNEFREEIVNDLKSGYVDIVITTVLRVGVSVKGFVSLILAQGGKDTIEIKQLIGRLLRDNGKNQELDILDFDHGGYYTDEHLKNRLELYKNEQFQVNYG